MRRHCTGGYRVASTETLPMVLLNRYSKSDKIRYRVYYPDGTDRLAFAYLRAKRNAENGSRCFDADMLTKGVRRLVAPIDSRLTLHSLCHPFAPWRLMMGDSLLLVKGWMGHASAETLLHYAHVWPDPLQDILPLLHRLLWQRQGTGIYDRGYYTP